jgi:hypothetical protein
VAHGSHPNEKGKEMKTRNLKYCMRSAYDAGIKVHPQVAMKELGITYQWATPQSIGDQWWFWNCKNVPQDMPDYLKDLKLEPHDCIGFGLSEEIARSLESGR